jgi:hypothetical protein
LSVSHYDNNVWLEELELIERLLIPDSYRLEKRNMIAHGQLFYRRRSELLMPPRRLVGLRDARENLVVVRLDKAVQRREADVPRTDENDPHPSLLQDANLAIPAKRGGLAGALREFARDRIGSSYLALSHRFTTHLALIFVQLPIRENEQ